MHSLFGENGAGTSSLLEVLTGVRHADSGPTSVDGAAAEITRWIDAIRLGISTVY